MPKLTLISDTHSLYHPDTLPDGDILIHAGDHSMEGTPKEVLSSIEWLASQPHEHKILVAGNHDFFCERFSFAMKEFCSDAGLIYLQDTGVEIMGLEIWGSPISPWFCDWAFGPHRGPDIQKHWSLIPSSTDILITHGPPARVLDFCPNGNVGCEDLLQVVKKIQPLLHVFGHIHEGRGETELPGYPTHFINASMLDAQYNPSGEAFTWGTS